MTTKYADPAITVKMGVNLRWGGPTIASVEVWLHRAARKVTVKVLRNDINTSLPTFAAPGGAASPRHAQRGDVIQLGAESVPAGTDWESMTPGDVMRIITGRSDWEIVEN